MGTPEDETPVRVQLPGWDRSELESFVREHVQAFNPAADTSSARIDALALNTLRHEFTDYDRHQSTGRMITAHESITAAYPHLTAEAQRQNEARIRRDSIFGSWAGTHTGRTPQDVGQYRRDREARSIKVLSDEPPLVGQPAAFRRGPRVFTGSVAWVGYAKVGVRLTAPDGSEHIEPVYGCDLLPVERQPPVMSDGVA